MLQSYTRSMATLDESLDELDGFEWDAGNSAKSWTRHRVGQGEAEQALLNRPVVVKEDAKHSSREPRFFAVGRTDGRRLLTVVFTVRGTRIRVISVRPMSRAERGVYGKAEAHAQGDS